MKTLALLAAFAWAAASQPLRLHPANPHYFEFRGKPAVLVTSGEHYGAVLNLDFDYVKYLDTLAAGGLNLTRTFSGMYREVPGSFHIERNTLAPRPDRFICPWPRAGEGKFDLSKWDPAYFARLKDFIDQAARRGIVVELNLFCPFYEDAMWEASPLNARNNVNGVGEGKRTDALTLKDPKLLAVEDAMVRKIAAELRGFDNLYYEICNEPYFGGVTLEWQKHISEVIRDADGGRHLISQNIANGSRRVEDPNPLVSIFNFHYSRPPESVAMNRDLNRAIGMNETGFDGAGDAIYRIQGWDFILAGGALYNNLDYSFVAGHEDGTFVPPPTTPGWGSPVLRRQLKYLKDFIHGLPFIRMAPAPGLIRGGVPDGASARALADPGRAYALYLHHARIDDKAKPRYQVDAAPHRAELVLDLPAGACKAEWLNPKTGAIDRSESFQHPGGPRTIASPPYTEDLALRLLFSA